MRARARRTLQAAGIGVCGVGWLVLLLAVADRSDPPTVVAGFGLCIAGAALHAITAERR